MAEETETVEEAPERPLLPEVEELVVATVKQTRKYGAYLDLEDYPCEGFVHISQLSARWVRKVQHVVRPGQKIVVKVLRIDEKNNSIDASLKDVPDSDKKRVMREWKLNERGDHLISDFSEKAGMTVEEFDEKIGDLFLKYKTSYDLLERFLIEPSLLDETDLTEEEKKELQDYLETRIKPKEYHFESRIEMTSVGRGGVYEVRDALGHIVKKAEEVGLEASVTADGPPKYLVKMSSFRPELLRKHAERIIEESLDEGEKEGLITNIVETS